MKLIASYSSRLSIDLRLTLPLLSPLTFAVNVVDNPFADGSLGSWHGESLSSNTHWAYRDSLGLNEVYIKAMTQTLSAMTGSSLQRLI